MKITTALMKPVLVLLLLGGILHATQATAAPVDTAKQLPKTPALDLARQLNEAFIQVADKVSSSVVVLTVTQKASPSQMQDDSSLWDALPEEFRRYFEEHGGRGQRGQRAPRQRQAIGRGSGIVISEDGYILTNNHVVEDADKIKVRFNNNRDYDAEVVGRDPQSDIAVVKIKNGKGFTPAKLGDSAAARIGEFVIAIGAPFDLDYSVTVGHISAKGRSFESDFVREGLGNYFDQDFIQTDASINPGNSGGPLVNLYGEVIGINTMIRGIGTGIGFAVPSNLAKQVSDHLIKEGKFVRSRIGVGINDLRLDNDLRSQVNVDDGVVVGQIMPDGPAAKSDLKAGDVVVAVDGKPVKTSRELKEEIAYKKVGSTVTLDVLRLEAGNKVKNLKIKVKTESMSDENDSSSGKTSNTPGEESGSFGLTVKTLTKELAQQYDIDVTTGVLVTAVEPGSVAEDKGIRPGDVITEVNRSTITNIKQFRDALKDVDRKRGVIVNFLSRGTSRFTILKEQ